MNPSFFAFVFLWGVVLGIAASAAEIEGVVYTPYLEPAYHAIVKITTLPEQTKVAADGTYKFTVPPGTYVVTATYADADTYSISENVSVQSEGTFTIDLILLPDFEGSDEEDVLAVDITVDGESGQPSSNSVLFVLTTIIMVALFLLLVFHKQPRHLEEHESARETDEDKEAIYALLKSHGGRMTQKEIRKNSPLSEAKISLLITELEHEGKVKKIKRGRGNIIVLQ